MNTRRWVVLVPHRDIAPHLEKRRAALFAAGLAGAFSLPAVIPLAVTERPLSGDELKALARGARAALGGRMLEAGPWQSAGAGGITVYGPSYTLPHLAFPGQLQICNCSGKSATVVADLQLKLRAFIDGEIAMLTELRAMLSGENSLDEERLVSLLNELDYLWAHFPDRAGKAGPASRNDESFLKRVRAEIDPFIKTWEVSRRESA